MKRRWIMVLFVGCVVVGAIMASMVFHESEPTYHGVSLTSWLCAYDSMATGRRSSPQQKQEAAEAVRQIGTNALPWLLKWMRYEPAPWRQKWRSTFDKLPHPLNHPGRLSDSAFGLQWELRNQLARGGFEILGREAAPAVPELFQMVRQGASTRLKNDARFVLVDIGTLADPSREW